MKKQYRISIGVLAMVAVGCGGGGSYHFTPPPVTGSVTSTNVPIVFTPPANDSHTTTVTDPVTGAKTTVFTVQATEPPVTLTDFPLPAGTVDTDGNPLSKATIVIPSGTTIQAGAPVALVPPVFPVPMDVDSSAVSLSKSARLNSPGDILFLKDNQWVNSNLTVRGGKISGPDGSLQANFIVISASKGHSLGFQVVGPMKITSFNGRQTKLTIKGNTTVTWNTFDGSLYPIHTFFTFPTNGGGLTGSKLDLVFRRVGPPRSGSGTFSLAISATNTKVQIASVVHKNDHDELSFSDPGTDAQDAIPADGINSLSISLNLNSPAQ